MLCPTPEMQAENKDIMNEQRPSMVIHLHGSKSNKQFIDLTKSVFTCNYVATKSDCSSILFVFQPSEGPRVPTGGFSTLYKLFGLFCGQGGALGVSREAG